MHLAAADACAVGRVELDDAARLGDLDDRHASAVRALHLDVELLVSDDEDHVD